MELSSKSPISKGLMNLSGVRMTQYSVVEIKNHIDDIEETYLYNVIKLYIASIYSLKFRSKVSGIKSKRNIS